MAQPQAPSPGGSFLGTAAASAAGVIGGALLLNSISSMFGHHGSSAFAAMPPTGSPWDNSAAGSDLARDAGLNDIGSGVRGDTQPAGLLDNDEAGDVSDLGTISAATRVEISAAATAPEPTYNTTTFVPTFTRSYRSMTSALRMRMQPDDTFWPIVQGSFEPWMRYSVEPR